MVIEDVQDLHLAAIGEAPMGDVGLPALVGLLGAEPLPRRPGPFLRLRHHEPAADQDPPDRGDGRHRVDPGDLQVGRDRFRAGVQALLRQLVAVADDLVLQFRTDRVR